MATIPLTTYPYVSAGLKIPVYNQRTLLVASLHVRSLSLEQLNMQEMRNVPLYILWHYGDQVNGLFQINPRYILLYPKEINQLPTLIFGHAVQGSFYL